MHGKGGRKVGRAKAPSPIDALSTMQILLGLRYRTGLDDYRMKNT